MLSGFDWYRTVVLIEGFSSKKKAEALLREKIRSRYGQIRLILYGGNLSYRKEETRFAKSRRNKRRYSYLVVSNINK